jgi:molybdopterin-guanine dinucleotide biosynthesis protein A
VKLGALILTGGAASRMGEDKAALHWADRRAVDWVADLARSVGADIVLTVGPKDYGLPFVADEPPLGGPVGAIMAGAAMLREEGCERALVLAVDAPTVRLDDLAPLLGHTGPGAAHEGFPLPMVLDLARLPAEVEAGWPVARLLDRVGALRLPCPPDAGPRLRGANTPEERSALLLDFARGD